MCLYKYPFTNTAAYYKYIAMCFYNTDCSCFLLLAAEQKFAFHDTYCIKIEKSL